MFEKLEFVLEQPQKVKIGILLGSLLLIFAGFWFLMYSPLAEQVEAAEKQITHYRTEIDTKNSIIANLPKFKKRVGELDIELKKALTELPDEQEIDLLLSEVSDKAIDVGLEVKLFKPKAEQRKGFYAAIPVEIVVNGTYHEVATFFDEVGGMERIVNLTQMSMRSPQVYETGVIIETAVVATGFRFLEQSQRPSKKPKRKKGK